MVIEAMKIPAPVLAYISLASNPDTYFAECSELIAADKKRPQLERKTKNTKLSIEERIEARAELNALPTRESISEKLFTKFVEAVSRNKALDAFTQEHWIDLGLPEHEAARLVEAKDEPTVRPRSTQRDLMTWFDALGSGAQLSVTQTMEETRASKSTATRFLNGLADKGLTTLNSGAPRTWTKV